MKKKILYVILLIVVVGGIVGFFIFLNVNSKKDKTASNTTQVSSQRTDNESENSVKKLAGTTVTTLDNGTLYSLVSEPVSAEVVLGDNYFDTQINDIMTNFNSYKGKTIEIEGIYLVNEPYTFVGRYSTSNLCPYCPAGYSYMEYEWDGENIELKEEDSWIKVIGTIEQGFDVVTVNNEEQQQEYYYIKASSIEVMNEKGQDTVNN